MRSIYFGMIFLWLWLPVLPQTSARNDELKFDADYFLMRKEFEKALDLFLNILKSEPDNADIKHRIGICYLNSEDEKQKAIPYLEEAVKNVSTNYNTKSFRETHAPIEAYFLLGSAYRVNNQLEEAIAAYEKYKEYLDPRDKYNLEATNQYIKSCRQASEMLKEPRQVTFTNLGHIINNNLPNFNPVVSGNGKTLVYTTPGKQGYSIFMSTLTDSTWSMPKDITSMLGSGKYMKTSSLSFDGLHLLLVLEDPENSDIYISHFKRGRWSKVEPLGKPINSKGNETHASFTPDGRILYFTSVRKGGEGDLDIYRCTLDGETWGKPENLGPEINTPYNEETPFISNDGHVLYFSSEGHEGIGGYDVFRYDFSHPEEGVVNLGYPINTTDNNLFFVPFGNDGLTAYYSLSGKDSYGGRDIYLVNAAPDKKEAERMAVKQEKADTNAVIAVKEENADTTTVMAVKEENADTTTAMAVKEENVDTTTVMAVKEKEVDITSDTLTTQAAAAEVNQEEEIVAAPAEEEQKQEVEMIPPPPAEAEKKQAPEVAPELHEEYVNRARSYAVQFMALRKPVDLTFFKGLSDISVNYRPDAWYRYMWITTTDSLKAAGILSNLVEKGYTDAFIRRKKIIPRYTVQVMAVPGPVTDLTRFSNLPEISVIKGKDKFCRYTTGEYERKEEALTALKQIRSYGYSSAFIRRVRTRP